MSLDSTWDIIKSKFRLIIVCLLISAFPINLFWFFNLYYHWDEPIGLTSLYRLYDYAYFPMINKLFSSNLGEAFFVDSLGQGMMAWQWSAILFHACLHKIIGDWVYPAGDFIFQCFRWFCFWKVAQIIIRPKSNLDKVSAVPVLSIQDLNLEIWLATALLFLSSQFLLGSIFSQDWRVNGIWGFRIPRDFVTSIFVLLNICVLLTVHPVLTNGGTKKRVIFWLSVPFVLLLNGDLISAISIGFVYFFQILSWFTDKRVKLKNLIWFSSYLIIFSVPFFIQQKFVSPDLVERMGRYSLIHNLSTIEIPTRIQFAFFILSLVGVAVLGRNKQKDQFVSILKILTWVFGVSMISSLVVGTVLRGNIQEYQYSIRRDQFFGLLLAFWSMYLLKKLVWVSCEKLGFHKVVFTAILFFISIASMIGTTRSFWPFIQEFSSKSTSPEVAAGFGGTTNPKWRKSAAEVLQVLQSWQNKGSKNGLVIGTMDHEFQVFLAMYPKFYFYLGDPQMTPASNLELESRLLNFMALLGLDVSTVEALLNSFHTMIRVLGAARFQFNRFATYESMDKYPSEILKSFYERVSNWDLYTPASYIKSQLEKYQTLVNGFGPSHNYRWPDVIVLTKPLPFKVFINSSYSVEFENEAFILAKLK